MSSVWDDPRIQRGMKAQLAARQQMIAAGAKPLGWKVGFGAPAAMAKLAITAPLIGFMTDRSILQSGSELSLKGWTKPFAEPEIAVRMGRDLEARADRATAGAAIAGVGPAIELVDLSSPPEEPEAILAGNIYHRHVILGPSDKLCDVVKVPGLEGTVSRNGVTFAQAKDLQANTGDILDIVRHVAGMLAAFGEKLRARDIVICGSVVPLIAFEPQDRDLAFEVAPCGRVELKIAA